MMSLYLHDCIFSVTTDNLSYRVAEASDMVASPELDTVQPVAVAAEI